jgi:hypothetical protein
MSILLAWKRRFHYTGRTLLYWNGGICKGKIDDSHRDHRESQRLVGFGKEKICHKVHKGHKGRMVLLVKERESLRKYN